MSQAPTEGGWPQRIIKELSLNTVEWSHSTKETVCYLLIQHGIEGFHCVEVRIAIVAANGEDFAHHRGDPYSTPGSGKCRHVIPLVASRVVPLNWTQGRIIIKTTYERNI